MKLGKSYELIFFSSGDLGKIARHILDAKKVEEYSTRNGKLYLALQDGEAIGTLIVEKDEKRNVYLAKALFPGGEVKSFVIFTQDGAKISSDELNFGSKF